MALLNLSAEVYIIDNLTSILNKTMNISKVLYIILSYLTMNRTILKTLSYLGAAINEGQPLKGVIKGPDVIRQSGVFETLRKIYKIENIIDYGNISFASLP